MILRIASYNVHGSVGTDGRRDSARVADVVRALDADVIALQEVDFAPGGPGTSSDLLQHLDTYRAIHAPIERAGLPFGNALLSRLPITSNRRICLAFPGREPRSAVDAIMQTGGRPLRVVATHLGLKPVERRFQVRKILEHVASDEQSITVLLGDFNEWFLMGRPLRWLHGRFGRGPAVRTFPSTMPIFALDRIWVHPRTALREFTALRGEAARRASDHLPVVANVEV